MTKNVNPTEIYKILDLEDLPGEEWRDVEGYEGLYLISNLGRVKSLPRSVDGRYDNKVMRKVRIMKQELSNVNYTRVRLCKNTVYEKLSTHRLVAIAFIDNSDNKRTVNHINGQKSDNRVENLEWATHSENVRHALKEGLKRRLFGENASRSLLKSEEVRLIKLILKLNILKHSEVGEIFNVSQYTIQSIYYGQNWKEVA